MTSSERLEEYFRKFPGIGSRQAKRFVYFLLSQPNGFIKEIADTIVSLKKEVRQCEECFRFFVNGEESVCKLCKKKGDRSVLVVEKDIDLETIEKSGTYGGRYFVLGGLVPILEKDPPSKVRIKELVGMLERDAKGKSLKEVILGFSLNAEGENTLQYVKKTLEPLAKKNGFKISALGRGFSTGLELEYTDSDTLKNALRNRA